MHNGGADIARKRRPVVENGGPGGGGAFPAAPVAESGVPGAASRAPPRSDTGSGDTATAAVGRRRATRVEGRRGERAAGGGRSADAYSSSSDSDFQFESSCSTCSSSDSELDASIYTETSGSCRSCAEAAVWEKFVDSKGNLFYLHPRPNPVAAESSRSKNGRDWKKTAGRRLKSFLKKKESNGDAAGDGAQRDQDGRRDVWLRVAKKCGGGRSSAGDEQSLLEEMFGILTASAASGEKFICVSDLVPDSPAAVSGKIRQGDRLVAVNSEPVSPRNVEDILGACARKKQKKVKLTLVPATALEVENPLAPVFKSAVDAAAGTGGGGGSRLRFDSLSGAPSHPAAAAASPSAVPPSPSGTGTANVKGRPYWISAWDSSRPELETESRQQEADSSRSRGFAALFSLQGLGDGGGGGGGDVNRVLYSYPGQLVGWRGQLAKLRGALLTLSQMTADVICATPVLSTVEISGTKAFVTYVVEGPDVLLLALCDDKYLSRSSMISRTCDLKRFLKLEFGTLGSMTSALVLGADKEDARSRVDAVFDVIFARPGQLGVGGGDGDGGRTRFEFLSSCIWECLGSCLCPAVPLKLGLRMQLDALLTDYEAGAWEYNVDFGANWLRGCYIVGSALFFKGYLLASHLNGRMLEEVFLLLRFRKLLEVTWSRAVDQLVVWQPIFSSGPGASEASAPLPGVQQKYLLVVGHGHQLFAVVLESTVFTVGRDAVAGPEYAYVQRGFKLLRQVECLRFTDVAAASVSAGVLSDGLGSVDAVLKSSRRGGGAVVRKNTTKGRSGDDQARRRRGGGGGGGGGGGRPRLVSAVSQPTLLSGVGSELQRRSSMFRSHSQLFDVDSAWDSDVESSKLSFAPGRLRDVDELDSAGRVRGRQDTWAHRGALDEPAASSTPIPSSGSRSSSFVDESVKGGVIISLHPDDIEDCRVDYRVSRGPCGPNLAPAVFHFVAEMRGRGLIVCPAEGDLLERDTPAFRQVLEQFRFSVAVIRRRFRMDRLSAGLTKSRFALNEQGMMFTLKNFNAGDKKHSSHSSAKKGFCKFWVVGRQFGAPVDQELYVCHHDAVPQDFAEIAFRLMNKMAD